MTRWRIRPGVDDIDEGADLHAMRKAGIPTPSFEDDAKKRAARPIVKSLGGKTKLLPQILARLPEKIARYHEPFVGGGAVFFGLIAAGRAGAIPSGLSGTTAFLSDMNDDLVNLYRVVQDRANLFPLILLLRSDRFVNEEKSYYRVRASEPTDPIERAARTLYLNKTCFTPGSMVLMQDETLMPIESVGVGDVLWNGRIVAETTSRKYVGKIRRIRVRGVPFTVSVTEDHPVLSIDSMAGKYRQSRDSELSASMRLRSAKSLKKGDMLLLPRAGLLQVPICWREFWPKKSDVGPQAFDARLAKSIDDCAIARLIGYYAGDGYIQYINGRPRNISWTLHKTKKKYIADDIVEICRRHFGITPSVNSPKSRPNTITVQLSCAMVAFFMSKLVPGTTWSKDSAKRKTKRLADVILTAPIEVQIEVLKGWLRCDGGIRHRGNRSELTGSCTVVPLARQMYRMAQRCGLRPAWRISRPKTISHPDGEDMANIGFSGDDIVRLGFDLPICSRRYRRSFEIGQYLAVRITEIVDLDYDGTVHNVEVDGDHLLCVDGVVSHNCFNGLARYNKKGKFNSPFGKYDNPTICDADNLTRASHAFEIATIEKQDFKKSFRGMKMGDVAYCDPPYLPLSATSSFTSYTSDGFSLGDHELLRDAILDAKSRGVEVLLSNSAAPAIHALYSGRRFKVEEIDAARAINSDASKRGKIKELLIRCVRAS